MNSSLTLLSCAIFLSVSLSAQVIDREVVASQGDENSLGSFTFSWTIGEVMTETFSNQEISFTQGFQQPDGFSSCVAPETVTPKISAADGGLTATFGKSPSFGINRRYRW